MPSQSKAGPCVAMHLIIGMAVVMLLAVIATSISLVTLTSHSRIVLYQTVKIEKGDARQSVSHGCVSNRYATSRMSIMPLCSCPNIYFLHT